MFRRWREGRKKRELVKKLAEDHRDEIAELENPDSELVKWHRKNKLRLAREIGLLDEGEGT